MIFMNRLIERRKMKKTMSPIEMEITPNEEKETRGEQGQRGKVLQWKRRIKYSWEMPLVVSARDQMVDENLFERTDQDPAE
jgi:hypothetical protein